MSSTQRVPFTKGHGTENDFVLLPDPDGGLDLTDEAVRWLCDRRAGIGADGVIRVVPTASATEPHVASQAGQARWFMDYRNADGSRAEMCGNGSRVFAAYLHRQGWQDGETFAIATRAGVKQLRRSGEQFAVNLGRWRIVAAEDTASAGEPADDPTEGPQTTVALGPSERATWPGVSLDLGNPHTVVLLPAEVDLDALDLTRPPEVQPIPPAGTNVEFVQQVANRHVRMRVHERGVGETRSCGTGAAAAALAYLRASSGPADLTGQECRVDVPGGSLTVRCLDHDEVELAGPAVLVADGQVDLPG